MILLYIYLIGIPLFWGVFTPSIHKTLNRINGKDHYITLILSYGLMGLIWPFTLLFVAILLPKANKEV